MTRRKTILLALLGVVALSVLVERLIVTDREAITTIIADDARAVSRGDWVAVAHSIDDDYSERGRDKAQIVRWAENLWRSSGAPTVFIDVGEIRVDGDRAAARIIVRPGSRFSGLEFPGRLEFIRRDDGWKIDGVAADDASRLEPTGGR